jgi:hypothetical protein
MLNVCWFSAGVSSFIAGYLERENIDKFIYIGIKDQHPDSERFIADCEKALGKEIELLKSKYESVGNVITQFRFINSAYGSKCTEILKKRVRKEWEQGKGKLTYYWGYNIEERHRAERIVESFPQHNHVFPLIDRQLKKDDCHGILKKLGIKRPAMYDMGYRNNNCVGCVKGGMGYWNKIRVDFPEVFAERAKQERMIGHSCLKECFLNELEPGRGNIENEVMEDCSIYCMLNS